MKNVKILYLGTINTDGAELTGLEANKLLDVISEAIEKSGYALNQNCLLANSDVDNMKKVKNEIDLIW